MMLTGQKKSHYLTFFYPENEEKNGTAKGDVIKKQQELNYLCRRDTQQTQIRQEEGFDKRTADAKAYLVREYLWVFQELFSPKGIQKFAEENVWFISNDWSAPG